jgi:hypothetical protein
MGTTGIKKSLSIIFGVAAAILVFSCGGSPGDSDACPGPNCGNGVCDKGEDIILLTQPAQFACGKDCPGTCGDGLCNPEYETKDSCPQDCPE